MQQPAYWLLTHWHSGSGVKAEEKLYVFLSSTALFTWIMISLKLLKMRPVFEKLNNGYYGDILKAISDNKKGDFSTIALFCLQIPI